MHSFNRSVAASFRDKSWSHGTTGLTPRHDLGLRALAPLGMRAFAASVASENAEAEVLTDRVDDHFAEARAAVERVFAQASDAPVTSHTHHVFS
jgi:hypothetical protein